MWMRNRQRPDVQENEQPVHTSRVTRTIAGQFAFCLLGWQAGKRPQKNPQKNPTSETPSQTPVTQKQRSISLGFGHCGTNYPGSQIRGCLSSTPQPLTPWNQQASRSKALLWQCRTSADARSLHFCYVCYFSSLVLDDWTAQWLAWNIQNVTFHYSIYIIGLVAILSNPGLTVICIIWTKLVFSEAETQRLLLNAN